MANIIKNVQFVPPSPSLVYGGIALTIIDKKANSTTTSIFSFKKMSPKEVFKLRYLVIKNKCKKTFLIYKEEDSILCACIPSNINLSNTLRSLVHLCSTCENCSAADDKHHGCARIRDIDFQSPVEDMEFITQDLFDSCRIEKYSFIRDGFEIFNGKNDSFFIGSCRRFLDYTSRPSVAQKTEILDQFHLTLALMRNNKIFLTPRAPIKIASHD